MPSVDSEEHREQAVSALFDATAKAPSEIERGRLSAHAAVIAERRGRARFLGARVVWPLSLSAAAAVAYLVIAPAHRVTDGTKAAPSATGSFSENRGAPLGVASTPTALQEAPAVEAEDPVVAVLGGPGDPFDLGPLMADGNSRNTAVESGDAVGTRTKLTQTARPALEMNERR